MNKVHISTPVHVYFYFSLFSYFIFQGLWVNSQPLAPLKVKASAKWILRKYMANGASYSVCPYLRHSGRSVPDSWLNFRCTLSSCRVRTSSWGTIAAELSLSRLSLRLLGYRGWENVNKEKNWMKAFNKSIRNVMCPICMFGHLKHNQTV